jgi:hypothetical protein
MIQVPIPYTTSWYTLEHRAEAPNPGVYLYLARAASSDVVPVPAIHGPVR